MQPKKHFLLLWTLWPFGLFLTTATTPHCNKLSSHSNTAKQPKHINATLQLSAPRSLLSIRQKYCFRRNEWSSGAAVLVFESRLITHQLLHALQLLCT